MPHAWVPVGEDTWHKTLQLLYLKINGLHWVQHKTRSYQAEEIEMKEEWSTSWQASLPLSPPREKEVSDKQTERKILREEYGEFKS